MGLVVSRPDRKANGKHLSHQRPLPPIACGETHGLSPTSGYTILTLMQLSMQQDAKSSIELHEKKYSFLNAQKSHTAAISNKWFSSLQGMGVTHHEEYMGQEKPIPCLLSSQGQGSFRHPLSPASQSSASLSQHLQSNVNLQKWNSP